MLSMIWQRCDGNEHSSYAAPKWTQVLASSGQDTQRGATQSTGHLPVMHAAICGGCSTGLCMPSCHERSCLASELHSLAAPLDGHGASACGVWGARNLVNSMNSLGMSGHERRLVRS